MAKATWDSGFFSADTDNHEVPYGFITIADIPIGHYFELGPGHEVSGERFLKTGDNVCLMGRISGLRQSGYTDEGGGKWEGPESWEAIPCD